MRNISVCNRLYSFLPFLSVNAPAIRKASPHLCIVKSDKQKIRTNKLNNQKTKIMNSLRNSVRLIGNLGAAPEVKNLDKGNKVAKLALATNESYTNQKGEKVTETYWHNLVAWGKTAEIAEKFLNKGSEVAIEGKLTNHSYTDKDGIKKYVTEVLVNEILLLDKKSQ